MNPTDPTVDGRLPATVEGRIDAACDRFEADWRAGRRPRLEDALADSPDPEQPALLRELLALELAYRRAAGEAPRDDEYLARLPEHASAVAAAFAEAPSPELPRTPADDVEPPTLDAIGSTRAPGDDPNATWSAVAGAHGAARGRYHVLRPHARGGLGEVLVALDAELNREVALKQIRAERADDSVSRARFLREAEITGGLEHPGIVPVYGLGRHGDGRPFYTMRFIRGESLREAIARFHGARPGRSDAEANLALRRLLRRFTDACNAIDYAHGRGVLHRDIKPSNIIVGKHGETLVVDWGLAKTTGRAEAGALADGEPPLVGLASSGSAETLPGELLGTPAFMSPEQAAGDLDTLGAASDVYSLGATLYALLTGRSPFEGDDVASVLRRVRQGQFPAPRQIDRRIDPALEAICLKALSLNAADRYETARALADDIERWMADEPVNARREPFSARARRWLRRHRTLATTAASLLILGSLGLGAFAVVVGGKNRQLSDAYDATRAAETEANQWLDQAMASIRDYYSGFAEDALAGEQVPKELRERLLARPLEFYESLTRRLAAKRNPSRRERALLAEGRFSLGRILYVLGRHAEARRQGEAAIDLFAALAAAHPEVPDYREGLADSLMGLGLAMRASGEIQAARRAYERATAGYEALVAAQPGTPKFENGLAHSLTNLGLILRAAGDRAAARGVLRDAVTRFEALVAARPDVPEYQDGLANSYNSLGGVLREVGEFESSRQAFEAVIARYEALHAARPGAPEYLSGLATGYSNLGNVLSDIGRHSAARRAYEQAVAWRERLVAVRPGVPDYSQGLAIAYNNLGLALHHAGEFQAARQNYEQAIARYQALVAAHPSLPDYLDGLASSESNLGLVLSDLGEADAARQAFEESIARRKELVATWPGVPGYQRGLATSYTNLGLYRLSARDRIGARRAFEEAITRLEELTTAQPDVPDYRHGLADGYTNLGLVLRDLGELDAARQTYEAALRIRETLARDHPESPDFASGVGATLNNMALIDLAEKRFDAARARLRQAVAWQRRALAANADHPTYRRFLTNHLRSLIRAAEGLGDADAAAEARRELAAHQDAVQSAR
jgi:serine/threonine protein kinase/TolA-binding protein/soluble cytochrome b562